MLWLLYSDKVVALTRVCHSVASKPDAASDARLDTSLFPTITASRASSCFLHLPLPPHGCLFELVPVVLPRVLCGLASVGSKPSVLLNVCSDGPSPLDSGVRPWGQCVRRCVLALLGLLLALCHRFSFLVEVIFFSLSLPGLFIIITADCMCPAALQLCAIRSQASVNVYYAGLMDNSRQYTMQCSKAQDTLRPQAVYITCMHLHHHTARY